MRFSFKANKVVWSLLLVSSSVLLIVHSLPQSSYRNWSNIALVSSLMSNPLPQKRGLEPFRVAGSSALVKQWIMDLEHQTQQQTDLAWVHRNLGLAYLAMGNDSQARSELEHSKDDLAQIHLVLLDAYEKKWDDAEIRLRLLGSPERLASTFVAIANIEVYSNQGFAQALPYLELGARLDLQGYAALLARGRVLQQMGNYEQALADYALVQDRCPICWQPYSYRAEIDAATGRGTPEQIEQDIRHALQLALGNGYIESQWGFWLRDHARDAEAIQQFERVIQVWPEFPDAYLTLSQLYQKQGNTRQALAVLALALKRFSDPAQTNQIVDVMRSIQNSQ